MAGLHQLVFAASFATLLLAVSAPPSHPPAAAAHGAGEWREWMVPVPAPPPRNGSGGETLTRWASRHRFHVGDVLDFKNWNGTVLVVRRRDYNRCAASSTPLFRFADGGGNATTTATSTAKFMLGLTGPRGLFYFIAAAPPRCKAGERMAVRVAARYPSSYIGGAPAAAPTPSEGGDGPEEDAPDQDVPSDMPWKKVAYAVLGFLAGGVFTFCVIFVFIRCCGSD
ncbi:hypothetical protein QOZ80_6AG0538850 [Eleusine coracana subsp. coracana]|nr:hypothetical protein QOZ80_6AG0538850 [Eleusine coracana subsp. coracana]